MKLERQLDAWQVLGAGALGWPREMGWGGRWEGGSGWGTHVNPWLIHINVWQNPLQYCKVISLQLIKINGNKINLKKKQRQLLLGRKVVTKLDSVLKSKDITLPTKVHIVKAMVFPVVMYGHKSWTIKKVERQRIDAFQLWCWRKFLRVPWAARRSTSRS